MMSRIERDEEREERIHDEAIIDAYGAEEQAMGWYYYLAETMTFPFQAKCIQEVRKSPLKLSEVVTVTDMVSGDDSFEMLAEIEFMGRTMGVPLYCRTNHHRLSKFYTEQFDWTVLSPVLVVV